MARPSIAPELRKVPKGICLTPAEWDKFTALGGNRWLAAVLASVEHPKDSRRHLTPSTTQRKKP